MKVAARAEITFDTENSLRFDNTNWIQTLLLPIFKAIVKFDRGRILDIQHKHLSTKPIQAQLQEFYKKQKT